MDRSRDRYGNGDAVDDPVTSGAPGKHTRTMTMAGELEARRARRMRTPELDIAALGPAQPLDARMAATAQATMGASLGDVQIHTSPAAAEFAAAHDARAVTVGTHIAFAAGAYQPGSPEGDALIAHELAHVVQQRGAAPSPVAPRTDDAASEHDADQAAAAALAHAHGGDATANAEPKARTGYELKRCDNKKVDPQAALDAAARPLIRDLTQTIADGTWPKIRARLYPQISAPAIQRAGERRAGTTPDLTGLGAVARLDHFAAAVHGLQGSWAGMSPDDRARHLWEAANVELTAANLPPLVGFDVVAMTPRGSFQGWTWTMNFSQAMISNNALSDSDAADLTNTTLHESRHSEQQFLAARWSAGQVPKPSASDIATTNNIPVDIARLARAHPITATTGGANAAERALAQQMFDSAVTNARGTGALEQDIQDQITLLGTRNSEAQTALAALQSSITAATIADARAKKTALEQQVAAVETAYRAYRAIPLEADAHEVGDSAEAAFRRTLAPPVQPKLAGAGELGADAPAIAARGLTGSSSELPHAPIIQHAFGRHDVSSIQAHRGPEATAATRDLGALAYASGDAVAFAGTPDLHTAAHEAAHVVQQRGGARPADGIGRSGDPLEQHADRVADTVVAGQSAEALLDPYEGGASTTAVQLKQGWVPPSVTAERYLNWIPQIFTEIEIAMRRIGMVARGPYGEALDRHGYASALLDTIQMNSSMGLIANGLARYVAPESIVEMIDRARGHDWDTSDEENPVEKSTGPASDTYASPVAVEITNALARRYVESVTRMFPQFLAAYVELQEMWKSLGYSNPPTVSENWELFDALHPMDTAVLHALYTTQKSIPLGALADQRPDLREKYEAKHAATNVHELDHPEHRPTHLAFPTERGLFHWVEAADDPKAPGVRTAAEVALELFGKTEESYRLIAVPPMWGFHAADIPAFKPEHRDTLVARWAQTSRDVAWPLDVASAIGMQLTMISVAQVDPVAELSGQPEAFAVGRAKDIAPPGPAKDPALVVTRLTENLKVIDMIAKMLGAVGRDVATTEVVRNRLLSRFNDATSPTLCIDADAQFALADQQGPVLDTVSSGLGDVAVKYATYGGKDIDPTVRKLLDDCIDPFDQALVALEFPEVAATRAEVGTKRVELFDISVQEASLHAGMPAVDNALDPDAKTADFDPKKAEFQSNEFAYDLGALRMQSTTDTGKSRTGLASTAPKVGDLEFDISLGDKLVRLKQLWDAIDGEEGFWESGLNEALGKNLKDQNESLRGRFIRDVKLVYEIGKATNSDDLKKLARDNFKTLLAELKPFVETVRSFIKGVERQKKWTKIIVGIAIAIVAFSLGQFEFAAVLAADGTIVEAAVAGGLVATSTSVVLEKLILNQDPTLGSLITGFIGNVAMFGVIGKLAMTARAAGIAAEATEATIGAAKAVDTGKAAAGAAAAVGADSAGLASNVAKGALALTKEVVLGEAIMLVQSETTSLIDNHELLSRSELGETLAMGVVNIIGMKVGQYAFDTSIDAFKEMRAAKGVDLAGLYAERDALHTDGMKLHDAAGGDHLAKGAAPREQARALVERWQKYFEREREVVDKLLELAEKHPKAFERKMAELDKLRAAGAADEDLGRQFREATALLGLEEVGPNLYRGDPAALDALLSQHKAAGSELSSVTTDPRTGQRSFSITASDGTQIEIVEKLADVGERKAPAVSVGSARAFEAFLADYDVTTPEGIQQKQKLLEYYARDPKAALELGTHYGFDGQALDESELMVKPDAPETANQPPESIAAPESSADVAKRAYDHYRYQQEGQPKPTGAAEKRVLSRTDFEAWYKAGFEYDPLTGEFVSRGGSTAAGHIGTTPPNSIPRTEVIGNLPSEAVGHEVMRRLVSGDAAVLRVVGLEPGPDFNSQATEWALGRDKDGKIVLIRGSAGEINWSHIPDVVDLSHSHPMIDPITRKPRLLVGSDKSGTLDVKNLATSANDNDLLFLLPSTGDLKFVALRNSGGHVLQTPYVYLGDGKIGNPQPGMLADNVHIVIGEPKPFKLLAPDSSVVIWRAEIEIWAGDDKLATTTMYQGRLVAGRFAADMPSMTVKSGWAEIPADHPVLKATEPGGSTPMADKLDLGKVDLVTAEQMHKTWGVDLEKMQGDLKGLNAKQAENLRWLVDESIAGRASNGFAEWMKRFQDPAQRAKAMDEVRVMRRELEADPTASVEFDATGAGQLSRGTSTPIPTTAVERIQSMAGGATKSLERFDFGDPATLAAAGERVKAAAQQAGETAYRDSIAAKEPVDKAFDKARRAVNDKITEQALAEREQTARERANRDVVGGTTFHDPTTVAQLGNYTSGTVGMRARELTTILPGMRRADFLAYMQAEVMTNGAVEGPPIDIAAPQGLPDGSPARQDMVQWEYRDGSEVRYKPLGDNNRPGVPAFSIEVKKNPAVPDRNPADASFKLDAAGNPVAKNIPDLDNPFTEAKQREAYENAVMASVHFELAP